MPTRAATPLANWMHTPVPIMPAVKQMQESREERWMSRSTMRPAKAADMPRKKMAREKAQPTLKVLMPMCWAMASLKVDQAVNGSDTLR